MPSSTYYDIISSTGPGGGTLAYKLAPSGKEILLFERGGYLRELETVRETRRTKASFTRGPGGLEDGW